MVDVKRGRELLADCAKLPWKIEHDWTLELQDADGNLLGKFMAGAAPGKPVVPVLLFFVNNGGALLSAAERVEAIDAAIPHADSPAFNALIATDVERDAAVRRAEAAERRVAELEAERLSTKENLLRVEDVSIARGEWLDRIAKAVGYDTGANPADVLQRIDDMRAAECALDEAVRRAEAAEPRLATALARLAGIDRWAWRDGHSHLLCPSCDREELATLDPKAKRCDECDPSFGCFDGSAPCRKVPLDPKGGEVMDPCTGQSRCVCWACERNRVITTLRAENERLRAYAEMRDFQATAWEQTSTHNLAEAVAMRDRAIRLKASLHRLVEASEALILGDPYAATASEELAFDQALADARAALKGG